MRKTHCDRCKEKLTVWTMSKFNRDTICMNCKTEEKLAPGYAVADEAEVNAVKAGNYNYPGIGLSSADQQFLALQLELRATVDDWELRVRQLESEGLTRSDAQGIVDAADMKAGKPRHP